MPNFEIEFTSGSRVETWPDARLNPRALGRHLYARVTRPTAPALATVVLSAVVGGVVAPLDAALGGDLFAVSRIAWSGSFPFAISQAAGQSSLITLRFAYNMQGHQEIAIRRPNGGAIILGFEVE